MSKKIELPKGWVRASTVWSVGHDLPTWRFKNTETGRIVRYRGLKTLSKQEAAERLWREFGPETTNNNK